jgi:hypothetical protein
VQVTNYRVRGKDVAIAIALTFFTFTMILDVRVPGLSYVDLGFHELGHLLAFPFSDVVTAMAGSIVQVGVPLVCAVYFWGSGSQHDNAGAGLCFGWAATSAADVARYIADAPFERLPLLGGDHDWAFVLSETHQMHNAAAYAALAGVVSWLMLLGGFALVAQRYVRVGRTTAPGPFIDTRDARPF